MDLSPLVQQGVDAYKAGNKEEAVKLLSDAIRENNQDENAWLYLGAALDDPARKRQAFERVLAINPNNERAKNALARLSSAAGPTPTAASGGTSSAPADLPPKPKSGEGFAIPFEVDGAPGSLTMPYIISTARIRIQQGIDIFTKQDFDLIVTNGANASQWDSVFIVGVGVVAVGAAEFLGRFIGFFLGGFLGGFGGLIITPIVAAIVGMAAAAAGFAAAVYASRAYLQNQNINVSMPQHSMYYALVWLPITLVSAGLSFLGYSVGVLILCLFPIFILVGLVLLVYGWYILKSAFDRLYGTENNRGLLTAIIAVVGGWAGQLVVRLILGGILNLHFGSF